MNTALRVEQDNPNKGDKKTLRLKLKLDDRCLHARIHEVGGSTNYAPSLTQAEEARRASCELSLPVSCPS